MTGPSKGKKHRNVLMVWGKKWHNYVSLVSLPNDNIEYNEFIVYNLSFFL